MHAAGRNPPPATTPLLIPLTNSLYVSARPAAATGPARVLVDVGTGFFVEMGVADATAYYGRRAEEVARSSREAQGGADAKTRSLRGVEEVLRVKLLAG